MRKEKQIHNNRTKTIKNTTVIGTATVI